MSDITAKREARRKRILENSESRLRKIAARYETQACNDQTNEEYHIANGIDTGNEIDTGNGIDTANGIDIANGMNIGNRMDITNGMDRVKLHINQHVSNYDTSQLLAKRLHLTLLAAIVNILLLLELDNCFGKAITIPYFSFMLLRLYNSKRFYQTPPNSTNLFIAALILCNIKPDFIYKFKSLFALFTILLHDFGFYIFTFVLIRYIINLFYYVTINT